METLRVSYKEDDEEEWNDAVDHIPSPPPPGQSDSTTSLPNSHSPPPPPPSPPPPPPPPIAEEKTHEEPNSNDLNPESNPPPQSPTPADPPPSSSSPSSSSSDDDDAAPAQKKQKPLSSFTSPAAPTAAGDAAPTPAAVATTASKKPKKKNNNVWTKPTSRKGKKKNRSAAHSGAAAAGAEDTVLMTPVPRFPPDKSDDAPDAAICLSRVYKAEKVELSDDRLSAGSTKGYRMVRATRGVLDGAWYFETKVVRLGETGHTRLGWTMEKGDLQAPVGYDGNSYGYRDIDGTKIHKALREKYGDEGYAEGDVIGFYISLPDGASYAPKPPNYVWYKGQRYAYSAEGKDDPPKVVPGSEISFFKNGICQGVAFTDLFGGRYYPAASMYTLPNQPNCEVKFNFGPDFEFFPQDFGGRPIPRPMFEVPYHGYDGKGQGPSENGVSEKTN